MEENNLIVLSDETGKEAEFEVLDVVAYEGKEYVVLLPAEENATEALVLEIEHADTDDEMYVSVEDEAVEEAVFALFEERYAAQEE